MGEIKRYAAGANICRMKTSAGYTLVELHELLAFLETPKEGREGTDIHGVRKNGHQV